MEVSGFEAVSERREVRIKIDASAAPSGVVRDLRDLVIRFPGEAPVIVAIQMSDGAKKLLQFGPAYRVQPDTDFITEVRQLLGASAVV
jgi:hypothetical protein